MPEDEYSALDSFRQLPDEGDAIFRIGAQLVRFTAREEYGRVAGWEVTTAHPGYIGYLRAGRDTSWTETGPEPMRTYSFDFRGGEDGAGPSFMSGNPTDVSVSELKAIYFGDHSDGN